MVVAHRLRGGSDGVPWVWLIALSLAVTAAPAVLIWMPPLLDYPNHYARMWLMAEGFEDGGPAAGMYAPEWSFAWTNIGIDLLARALGPWLPTGIIGRLAVTLAVTLPPLGAILLHRRLFGGWRWWQAVLPLAAWSCTLIGGFLNYHIGMGAALLAAALDTRLAHGPAWRTYLFRAAIGGGLIVLHTFALLFYAALLCGLAVGPRICDWRKGGDWLRVAGRLVLVAASVLTPLALFLWFVPVPPGGGQAPITWEAWSWSGKLYVLQSAIGTYDIRIDRAFYAPIVLVLGLTAGLRRLQLHLGLLLTALALVLLSVAAPAGLGGAFLVNQRLPILALLTLLVSLNPFPGSSHRLAIGLAVLALGLSAGRAAWIWRIWDIRQQDIRELRAVLELIAPGASVLTLEHTASRADDPLQPPGRRYYAGVNSWNHAALAVPLRQAFVPTLFAMPGKQPLRVLEPWARIAAPDSPPANIHALDGRGDDHWKVVAGYARCWRTHFDYALVTNADVADAHGPLQPPPGLSLVADRGFARLYRIDRQTPFGGNPANCEAPLGG